MINDLFPELNYDNEAGLQPARDYLNRAKDWVKEHASVMGLALAIIGMVVV